MAWGYGGCGCLTCESQCPPQEVCVQPAAFCITVPGPIMHCYTDPLDVCCYTPCCNYGCGGYGGYGGYGGRGHWGGGYGGYGGRW